MSNNGNSIKKKKSNQNRASKIYHKAINAI